MSLFYIAILAVVQGITEFLPISSSAHLALLHQLGGTTKDGLALDVAVHLGSILAVILYFRRDSMLALRGLGGLARGHMHRPDVRLARNLVVATVPAVLVGGTIAVMGWAEHLRDVRIIGWTMILFGLLLWAMDHLGAQSQRAADWSGGDAVKLGLWQVLSLVPGVSRSGICITGARALGYERHDATRISMLMSIPITLATGGLLALDVARSDAGAELVATAGIAAVLAFGAAYIALALMMRFLDRVSFTPYVIYRVILGIALLALAYGGSAA
ncbi:undecaprenyl-diphosphate phosphatase [Maritimibacter sp. 55A14]|uniref:undecaprenyl-diphosphate phosphatase n=1 Tax=Maritimibacter sp. 55A14 TaxID=2174844 RepID=UPI000D6151A7|nr:undecaprenyl-diphosphate phosphatase [Maritimibacter sp. 55A14]PWE33596.1 undecaprenyl-diphosphate phosphatase [Maritimibacter sp. 55A14]